VNKSAPFIIIGIVLVASLALFKYAKNSASCDTSSTANTLLVGTNAEYPPFSFMDNNTIAGFDIDVAHEVAKRLGKEIKLVDMPFDALLPKLQLGELHLIAAGMTPTPERAQKVLFTKPYLTGDPLLIIVPKNKKAALSVDDLQGKEVIVNEGYTADLYLSTIKGINLKRLATPAEAFMALTSGQGDAFVAAQSSVLPYFERHGQEKFHIAALSGTSDTYALALAKQYAELLVDVQKALDAMEQDGTLTTLKTKWKLQ
jgi:ABC-type amino acid transport substrate-binding protein